MGLYKVVLICLLSLLCYSCNTDNAISPEILNEIKEGNYTRLIINQDWSADYIYNHDTSTTQEGYFIFHFSDDGYFYIDAYDKSGRKIDYPIFGGEYKYLPGNDFISVDFRHVGQGNPFWPRTDKWQIVETDHELEDMPNPYKIAILSNNERLMTDIYPGNILDFKKK